MKSKTKKKIFAQKVSLFFFLRPRMTAILCLALVLFGGLSYATLQKREGFPAISTPFALTNGTYIVNDPAKVDSEVAKPLSDFILKQPGVESVLMQSFGNFYAGQISYSSDVDATVTSKDIQQKINDQKILPDDATNKTEAFKFGFTERGDDLVLSFYSKTPVDNTVLISKALAASEYLNSQKLSLVESVSIINPFEKAINPQTGAEEIAQKSFERFGTQENGNNNFYNAALIGFSAVKGSDNIELDTQVRNAVDELLKKPQFSGYDIKVSASSAPQINQQISELQKTLLEGLLAVLIIGSLVIAIRASIMTVLSMITVIATVNGLLYLLGYSLNTITLFGLILSLSLIVDDTIIMVEALESQKHRQKTAKAAVSVATRKVSRAMIAATLTACLSFVPLIFVSGILGSFIRAIPITIIAALLTSLVVAIVFIPLFARGLIFTKFQMEKRSKVVESAKLESKIAEFISKPMLWTKKSRKRLVSACLAAFFIGFGFIGAGGFIFTKVTFNIFPSAKDANQIAVTIQYKPGTTIQEAESIAKDVENIASKEVGDNLVSAAYFGQANTQTSILTIDLKDYNDRKIKAPEIIDNLKVQFKSFSSADVSARQVDAGPPASPFTAHISTEQDREKATVLAGDIANFLEKTELKRPSGTIAKVESVTRPNTSIYSRSDGQPFIQVTANFADTDTTTLVTLAQSAVEDEFNKDRLATYGLNENTISFDFGQESENQDSFKVLAYAFPLVLVAIFILLAVQFRSLLQPILIFMAIPFSLLGVAVGLYLTNNALSFFAMLGFFALIGLSIKNTILLTDYANQARDEGMGIIDAAHAALGERFRPLIATSLTAIVSLIPLAITSPFWEGLAVVLIFGLFSSTFLVITVFPYYYIAAEYLRAATRKFVRWYWGHLRTLFR